MRYCSTTKMFMTFSCFLGFIFYFIIFIGELYSVACSPTDATLVATGGGDDRGFLWKIGIGDWASELQGFCMTQNLLMGG